MSPPTQPLDDLAVVIATRNRRASLLVTLERLEALPERPRVVVVDNGSSDDTVLAVRSEHPTVEVLSLAANRGGAARNVGAEHVRTRYVAFSDDDSWWAPGALARAGEVLDAYSRLAVLAARALVGPEAREDPTCAAMAKSPLPVGRRLPGPPVLGFIACGAVVRRAAFLAVGGFHARLGIGGEEELLALDLAAAGWELAYIADVVAVHHPSPVRDHAGRQRVATRNALWCAWLRRPLGSAVRHTVRLAGPALWQPAPRAGVTEAVRGLGWVARERRPVPPAVDTALRVLDARR